MKPVSISVRKRDLKRAVILLTLLISQFAKAQKPDLIVQTGHTSLVLCGTFSPDGKIFASGSLDHTIKLRDVASGEELKTLRGHTGDVNSVAFSPDGKTLASGSFDMTIKLWDVVSGQTSKTLSGHTNSVRSVAFSPDGQMIASGSFDNTVKLWDFGRGLELRTLSGHRDMVGPIAFSPDGKMLASAGQYEDKTIKLWSIVTGQELMTLTAFPGGVKAVAFSADGKTLASSSGGVIKLWNVATGQVVRDINGHSESILAVAFSPDGKVLASAGGDQTVKVWNVDTGELLTAIHASSLFIAFSPDGKTLASGDGNAIKLWNVVSGREAKTFMGHTKWVLVFASSPDGSMLASGGGDNLIKLWNLVSEPAMISLKGPTAEIRALAFSPNGNRLASGYQDGTIKLWDVASGQEIGTLTGHTAGVLAFEFSPDGRTLVSESWHGVRDVWSDDGKTLGSGVDHGIIKLWDVDSGRELRSFRGAFPVGFSPDGRMLASIGGVTGAESKDIKLFDASTGLELAVLKGHTSTVFSIAFSPNGRMLASGGNDSDGTIRLWDMATGLEVGELIGHARSIVRLSYSSDGKILASGSWDKTVRLWDVSSRRELESFPQAGSTTVQKVTAAVPNFYSTYQWETVWPVFKGGKTQIEIAENGKLNLYDVRTDKQLATLVALDDNDWVVVTPDGRFDTNRLENPEGLHWVLPDTPFTPLSLEIFMRDYYEPKLLARLMKCSEAENCDREFKPVRDLSSLNRTQPGVEIIGIKPTALRNNVEVSVEVNSVVRENGKAARDRLLSSGVYDLRLFRDGQLVGHSTSDQNLLTTFQTYESLDDEIATWRQANRVNLNDGKKTLTFTVKLPMNSTAKDVEFSAYAFNEDRVKSNTARVRWPVSQNVGNSSARTRPRAYVIAVGVNANENPAFNLQFAANDARRFQEVLPQRLAATGDYSEVIPVSLISDWEMQRGQRVATKRDATKANFKAVLDLLAGRPVPDEIKRAIPNAEKLARTTPDDLVLILFSSHGYADQSGNFYFIPYDTGSGSCSVFTETVRQRSISSDELSLWLRDVDAGQMTLIVDACYSTAAIEGSGFKPGPMGSRGLGQLAYDKRMRILTATQADNVAMELPAAADGRPIKHGLLSYALLEDGLGQNLADFKPQDKTIFMDEWLEYAVADVPKLFVNQPRPINETRPQSKQRNDRPRLVLLKRELADPGACRPAPTAGPSRIQEQQPSLFDFTRRKREVPLVRNP